MGHKKINLEKINDLTKKNVLTRRVLFEKVKSNPNKLLFIYTVPKFSLKNPLKGMSNQLKEGVDVAMQFGLTPNEYSEYINIMRNEQICVGRVLLTLLKKVLNGEVKHVFVRDVKLFSRKYAFMTQYVINFLVINDVCIYTKQGLMQFDYFDLRQQNDNPFVYFIQLISEIQETYETVRN